MVQLGGCRTQTGCFDVSLTILSPMVSIVRFTLFNDLLQSGV